MRPSNLIMIVFCVLTIGLASPLEITAGEWCCDDPVAIFIGKADPTVTCHNGGRWEKHNQTEEKYFECALGDLSHSYDYNYVVNEYGIKQYTSFIKHIISAHKQYPSLTSSIEHFLLYKRYYQDKQNRGLLDDIFITGSNNEIWKLLADASDNKPCAKAKLFYQYCNYTDYIEEYLHETPPTLDEIIECQTIPSINAHNGTVKCINAQSKIVNSIINLVRKNHIIKKEYLSLLEYERIKYVKNSVYAKHGRIFKDQNLTSFFTRRDWYKINDSYVDSLLSAADKKNLSIITEYESTHKVN